MRGASTITQQLAKNLFLSREKSLQRKLRELSYSFLLESTLGKVRILEIYLNVIEWGPGLYGLRPAARHYFDKEPQALSPREVAFLVSLIPGPVKYQASIQGGEVRRGFDVLVNNLLAKMRSIDVITEEKYQEALSETLALHGPPPPMDEPRGGAGRSVTAVHDADLVGQPLPSAARESAEGEHAKEDQDEGGFSGHGDSPGD